MRTKNLILVLISAIVLTLSLTSSIVYGRHGPHSHFGYLGFFLRFKVEGPYEAKVGENITITFTITADYDMYIALAKLSLSGAGISWSEFLEDVNLTDGERVVKIASVKPTEEGEIYCVVKARYDVWFYGWNTLYEEYGSVRFIISYARNVTYDELVSRLNTLNSLNVRLQMLTCMLVIINILTATVVYLSRRREKRC